MNWVETECGVQQVVTIVWVTYVQKGFLVRIWMMELLTKNQIFSKLPQITHIYKNRNFSGIIVLFRPTASAL